MPTACPVPATSYELAGAHPYYRREIPLVLGALCVRYPRARLERVILYPRRPNDESMGNVNERGTIALNPRWFAVDPKELKDAAKSRTAMPLGGGKFLAYHGRMTEEPLHVVTHEFFHIVQDYAPEWQEFTAPLLAEARAHPDLAPAAYGLTNATEYWSELATAAELGLTSGPHVDAMREKLKELRT